MGTITKEIIIGALIAVFTTACGLFIYLQYNTKLDFYQALEIIKKSNLISTVLVLASIPNLLVFWIFIKKKQDYRARGVLLVTIFTAITTTILKFL